MFKSFQVKPALSILITHQLDKYKQHLERGVLKSRSSKTVFRVQLQNTFMSYAAEAGMYQKETVNM